MARSSSVLIVAVHRAASCSVARSMARASKTRLFTVPSRTPSRSAIDVVVEISGTREQQRVAKILGKPVDLAPHPCMDGGGEGRLLRTGLRRRKLHRIGLVEVEEAPEPAPAPMIHRPVPGDPRQPGPQLGLPPEGVELAEGGNEGFLGHVLGILAVAERGQRGPENGSLVALDNFIERGGIAVSSAMDKLLIGHTVHRRVLEGRGWQNFPAGPQPAMLTGPERKELDRGRT